MVIVTVVDVMLVSIVLILKKVSFVLIADNAITLRGIMSKVEEFRKRKTDIDFTPYIVTVEKYGDEVLIHKFKKPNTTIGSVIFINTKNIMAVTGDYGNWIFCREFHPSADGYVSVGYWLEKLRISSSQEPCEWDEEYIEKEIKERLKEEDIDEERKQYYEDLLNHIGDGEARYMVYAYDNMPDGMDCESIPCSKRLNYWLEAIFDIFNEICRRMEKEEMMKK